MKCPVCNNSNNKKIGELKYALLDDSALPSKVNVTYCTYCGFVRNEPLLEQINYNEYKSVEISVPTLSHILEHIVDLPEAMNKIKLKLLNKEINEKIYVEVPDTSNFTKATKNPIRYFYISHLNHFDINHLRNLFFSNNFKEIKSGYSIYEQNNLRIPSVWGIYSKIDGFIEGKRAITHDFSLGNKIKSWFNSQTSDIILSELALSDRTVYLWGLGIHTQIMLGMSPLRYCNILQYIDSNKKIQNKSIDGNKIQGIDVLNNATEKDTIVIGAPTHSKEMFQYIKQIGFNGEVISIGFTDVTKLQ